MQPRPLRGLFGDGGTPLHNYASYLGVADLAVAAVRAERRMEGRDVIEQALSPLNGSSIVMTAVARSTASWCLSAKVPTAA
jgi:hypothetical protein